MESIQKLTIATWNVCLGVANKKDIITEKLKREKIGVCCLQETEILPGFPEEVLNCNDYTLELESNDTKKRVGIYLHKDINYQRRKDLECDNMHVVIVDIVGVKCARIVSVYKSFRPQNIKPGLFFYQTVGNYKQCPRWWLLHTR